NDSLPGTDWGSALKSIATAVAKTDADEVFLSVGTHQVATNVVLNKAIAIKGILSAELGEVIVKGNSANVNYNRAFYLNHSGALIENIKIDSSSVITPTANQEAVGGGVLVKNGTIRNCWINDCQSYKSGGGVYIETGTIENSLITGNTCGFNNVGVSTNSGGGLFLLNNVSVINCRVLDNTSTGPGGGISMNGNSTITDCAIENNTAANRGGGVVLGSGQIINSSIANNSCGNDTETDGGGGVFSEIGGAISKSRIVGNSAGKNAPGGGVCVKNNSAEFLLFDTLIASNTAVHGAGVMLWSPSLDSATIRNSLVAYNKAEKFLDSVWSVAGAVIGAAGGVSLYNAETGYVINCTIAKNIADEVAGGVYTINSGNLINTVIFANTASGASGEKNWANMGTFASYNYCISATTPPGNNSLGADPLFVDANAGNFVLQSDSPAVNAGLNDDWMVGATDFNGQPRIRHTVVDMGCFETLFRGTVQRVW
ncbi:MAG: hypothetical protein GX811_05290, partial [Lentisphaerae bacterium]|nr:hypothetical protein [Lentisphaerota bacterium]